MAIRLGAIPVVLLSVHGATVVTVSSPSPAARATTPAARATTPAARATAGSPTAKPKTGSPAAKGQAAPGTAAARLPRVPGLRISIGDGRTMARVGDRLTYTVLVQNSGAHRSPQLKITQILPPGLQFISASSHGVARAGDVVWSADLAAGGHDTFRLQAQVTRPAERQSRLAAVACATLAGSRTPIVCAAHLDRLPGTPAVAPRRRAAALATSSLPGYAAGVVIVVAACALAIVTGLRLRVRRRRRAG
jgi:uncharacterized repeat protein (TIGR01451 family)